MTQRLELLDSTMCEARKLVQDQKELSTAFQQNQTRASQLGDASILQDLCLSHSNQLTVMLQNHNRLLDFEKRIMKAKEELGENLNKRLDYVARIENSISDLDSNLLLHHENFRRLTNHMVIIEQIHEAPTIYVTAVNEVVRRKIFSNAMLKVSLGSQNVPSNFFLDSFIYLARFLLHLMFIYISLGFFKPLFSVDDLLILVYSNLFKISVGCGIIFKSIDYS